MISERAVVVDPGMRTPVAPALSMKLAVVIVNWNAVQDTAACLRSLRAWEAAGGVGRPTVWVVDNGSRPPGIEPIRLEFPEVHVVQSPVNRGFGGGSNLGIERALACGARAILLLNNDASVDGASVAAMLETLGSDPAVGVVGPTLWHEGRCVSAGGRDIVRHRRTHLRLPEPPARLLEVDYVSGTVALVKREVFERLGPLDEDYFFGGEMADLCHRARRLGFRSVTDPRARARHDLGRSARERQTLHLYYILRNRFLFVRKHYPRQRAWLYTCWTARAALTGLVALGGGNWTRARAVAFGVVDGLRGRVGGQNERVLS